VAVIEKQGEPRDVWVTCPHCGGLFYIEQAFFEPKFNALKLFCPHCRQEFAKEDSLQIWGR